MLSKVRSRATGSSAECPPKEMAASCACASQDACIVPSRNGWLHQAFDHLLV